MASFEQALRNTGTYKSKTGMDQRRAGMKGKQNDKNYSVKG